MSGYKYQTLELDGFLTRHLIEVQFSNLDGLIELMKWLSEHQARLQHCAMRPGEGIAYFASLAIERIEATALMEHLQSNPCVLSQKIEHLLVNERSGR